MANSRIVAAVLTAFAALLPAQEKAASTAGAKPVDAAATGRGLTIGVVDLDKVIEQYPKAIAEREKLQKLQVQCSEQDKAESKHIEEIRAQLPLIKEGTSQREDLELEITLALQRRDQLRKFLSNRLDREVDKYRLAIYQDLDVAVTQVARDRGVQIVFRVRQPSTAEEIKEQISSQQHRLATYNHREILFAADEVDLTPALIKYLLVPIDASKATPAKPEAPDAAKSGNGQK